MIVSALLTSVGINLGLCVLFFALYSILRKQPGNAEVYAPRLVAEGRAQRRSEFNVERLLPTPGWAWKAWQTSEDEILSSCGLDAVVFMRIFIFSLRVFCFAGILGMFILLPVNFLGDELNKIDFSDFPNKSLDLFSISNVKNGSNRLWFHFTAAYLVTGVVCYLLYYEYKYISCKRVAYFNACQPQPHQFTVLVRGIPLHDGSSLSEIVDSFFMEYHPSTYLSHIVVRHTSKLRGLMTDAESLYRKLTHLKSRPHTSRKFNRGAFLGLFGKNVDLVGHYSKKLEDLEESMRMKQLDTSMAGEEVPAAFVCFKSRYGAATALHVQQSIDPTQWVTEPAPEPLDVYWPFFSTSFMKRWLSKVVVIVAYIVLTVLYVFPVAFVQGLTNLDQLETFFPFLKSILEITVISQLITGYLPSLILNLVVSFVPPIMKLFSTMQGYFANSEIEKSACSKMLGFNIWNIFFVNVLTGSVAGRLNTVINPKDIPLVLAIVVPAQATFFVAYVVTSWTSLSFQLTRMSPLIGDWMRRHFPRCMGDELRIPSLPYHSEIPRLLLFEFLGLVYFLLTPVILPFILIFFCIGYIVHRNQLLNVYVPKYETGGRFWPIVHNSTIFSLVLMQAIAVGIFGLKKVPLASSLVLPLPVLTLLFNEYCRKRFLPIFNTYSAESLIKKDREDQNDPAMGEFFRKLVTAYNDPALMPVCRTLDANDHSSPLLASAEALS